MNNPNYLLQQHYAPSSSVSSNLLHPNPTLDHDYHYHAQAPLIYDHQHHYHQAPPYINLLHPNPTLHEDHAGAPLIHDHRHQYHHQAPQYANGANANGYLNSFPPGYSFMPYDHELIRYYLIKKVNNEDLPPNNIHVVNIYASNPDELAESYKPGGENEWYFFASRDRKYMNGKRPSRSAKDGYWKASGADKDIMYEGVVIGFKKNLVFYQGKPPKGVKTDWLMHEFTLKNPPIVKREKNDKRLDDCVLCKIYTKRERKIVREGEAQIEECSSDDQTLHNYNGILYDNLENGHTEPNEMLYDDGSINEYPSGIFQPQLVTAELPVMPSDINLSTSNGWHDDFLDSLPQLDPTEWIFRDI